MIIGNLLLTASLAAALAACYYYFLATRGQDTVRYARWATGVLAVTVGLASIYLMALILTDQFQVEYVFENSSASLPVFYKVSAFWAGQEGSILLWLLFGALYAVAMIAVLRRDGDKQFEAPVLFVMNALQLFPLVLLMLKSPFRTTPDVPFDGRGLNPLLQDPYMVIHPPILFLGFAGMATAYAFGMAALWKRQYNAWTVRAWPWMLAGWGFLGLGLSIGGFWAYRVLGWGGYWGWDPVENSSLVPWLIGGGLVHGLMAQKARGRLVRWNLFMAVVTYVTVLYSTFLTRSGVLADFSVHTFGQSPLLPVMLAAVLVVAGAGLALFIRRYKEIPAGPDVFKTLLSRDFTSLATVIAFLFAALAVSVGTSSPIITGIIAGSGLLCGDSGGLLRALGDGGARLCQQSNVSTSYYNATSVPLGAVLAVLMTIAPILAWQQSRTGKVWQMLRLPLIIAVVGTVVAVVVMMREPISVFVVFFTLLALGTNATMLWLLARANVWKVGGYLAHVGVALALVGIIGSSAYKQVQGVAVFQGQTVQALGYSFQFQGLEQLADDKWAMQVLVRKGDEVFIATPTLMPTDMGMVRHPFIRKYLTEDLYISPGDYIPGKPAGSLLELAKGASGQAAGYTFRFVDYARSGHDTQSTVVTVGAILEVTKDGVTTVITPTIATDPQKGLVATPVVLPGTKIEVTLDAPQMGSAIIGVVDAASGTTATPPSITLEVSREYGINLLWAGLLIIAAGVAIAVVRRRLESRRALALEAAAAAQQAASRASQGTTRKARKGAAARRTSR